MTRVQILAPSAFARMTGIIVGRGSDADGEFVRVRTDKDGELLIDPAHVAPLTECGCAEGKS